MTRLSARRLLWIAVPGLLLLAGMPLGYKLYVRHVEANFRTVVKGQVYRSGQPKPGHLKSWKERYGIRSIVNLRGTETEDYAEERKAAAELELTLVDIEWSARRIPGVQGIQSLLAALEKAERPVLIHCAAGVDRTGVAGAIAAMAIGGVDYRTAVEQIGSKYKHRGQSDAGVVGLFQRYEDHCRERGLDTGAWPQFHRWIVDAYKE